jgi:hypothetical protein
MYLKSLVKSFTSEAAAPAPGALLPRPDIQPAG